MPTLHRSSVRLPLCSNISCELLTIRTTDENDDGGDGDDDDDEDDGEDID